VPDFYFDDDNIPCWYKKFGSEHFDKVKINRAIKNCIKKRVMIVFGEHWVVTKSASKSVGQIVFNIIFQED
jgi:hypothetical protein